MDTTTPTPTAEELITASITYTTTVNAAYTPELADHLMALSDDSDETASVLEYWGTDDDGHVWRVRLVAIPHELILGLVSLIALSDECGDKVVWHHTWTSTHAGHVLTVRQYPRR